MDAEFGEYAEASRRYRAAWEENRETVSRNFGDNLEPSEITMPQTPAKVNGRAVVIEGVVRESAAGDPVLELRGGGTAKLGEVTFSDEASRALYEAAGQYNGGAARTFLRQYTTSVPLKEYSRSFDLFYRSGLEGLSLESAMKSFDGFAGLIGESRAVAAYNTGMTQRQAKMKAGGASDGTPLRPNQIIQEGQADMPGSTGTGDSGDPLHSGRDYVTIETGTKKKSGATDGGLGAIIKNGTVSIDDIRANPNVFSGKSPEEIADVLRSSGYDVTIKNSAKSRSGAKIIQINNPGGGKNISQVQISFGGGRHGRSPYVKISTTDQGIIKIVDGNESAYKTDGKESATIIFSGGE